ncbi:hypothetical protein ACPPVW_18495 [Leifsonia sp. McL0607]|uniref:hypothetical protein n=1 Tax=Leifsonia sp. McL0607 TaxID=3415672 RepID=UPI003CF5AC3D
MKTKTGRALEDRHYNLILVTMLVLFSLVGVLAVEVGPMKGWGEPRQQLEQPAVRNGCLQPLPDVSTPNLDLCAIGRP